MGYASTTIVVYGVRLDGNDAEKLYNHMNSLGTPGRGKYGEYECYADQLLDELNKKYGGDRYYPDVLSDDTDSRVNSLRFDFDDGWYSHVFGVFIASRGYGCDDKLEKYICAKQPKQVLDVWNKVCKPMLDAAGIKNSKPDIVLVNQVW